MANVLYGGHGVDLSIIPMPTQIKTAPKVVGIKPLGMMILIELLNSQELTSNKIIVGEGMTIEGPPQAYVLDVGPHVPDEIKAIVGKRVAVNGKGVNVPELEGGNGRTKLLVEYPMIKAVLEEETPCCESKPTKKKCCSAKD